MSRRRRSPSCVSQLAQGTPGTLAKGARAAFGDDTGMNTTHGNARDAAQDLGDVEGIFGVDGQGNVTFVNPAAAQMLGYTMADLMGQPFHELVQHSRADGSYFPRVTSALHAALADGAIHHDADEAYFRRDGSCFPVEAITTPIRDAGRVVGAIVTFRDLTLRKRVAERFKDEFVACFQKGGVPVDSRGRFLEMAAR